MRYRNTRTQAVIETACVVSGGDWVVDKPATQPEPATQLEPAEQPKRKTTDKKGGER